MTDGDKLGCYYFRLSGITSGTGALVGRSAHESYTTTRDTGYVPNVDDKIEVRQVKVSYLRPKDL